MIIIRKKFRFCAAHRLSSPCLSPEENTALYGQCASPNFHGHNYTLEVAVSGEPDPATGMLINFYDLKTIVQDVLISSLDHKNLNMDVDFLKDRVTTAENMIRIFWDRLDPFFTGNARLYEISLSETDDNIAVYRRDS